jgi:hypothetical protein
MKFSDTQQMYVCFLIYRCYLHVNGENKRGNTPQEIR